MNDLIGMLAMAFAVGLTGALAPGPTLVATVDSTLKNGWTAGPKVAVGHALLEFIIFILIVGGLAAVMQQYSYHIATVGGLALMAFGFLTIMESRNARMVSRNCEAGNNPYVAGVVTSAANPYFWIWWLSIGSALVLSGLQGGVILAGFFMIGPGGADVGWLTLVSTSLDTGKNFLSVTNYRRILAACGGFLVLFGFYYLTTT